MRATRVFAFAAALCAPACQNKSERSGSPPGAASAALSALPTASAAPSGGDDTTGASFKCPFPKRCTPECKAAFWRATNVCQKESAPMITAMGKATTDAYGKCNAACVTHQDQCIGAANEAECRCAEACEKGLSAEVKATFAGYKRCVARVIGACE